MGLQDITTVVNADPEAVLSLLAQALGTNKKSTKEITTTVEKSTDTRTIIVPAGMTYLEASKELKAQHDNEEQVIDVLREFEGWEWRDVLVAIKLVSEAQFGWIHGKTEQTFFGEIRPKEIDIVVDVVNNVKRTEKCFYGKFIIAAWEKAEATVGVGSNGCYISIKVKKKYSEDCSKYFDTIEQHLQNSSIFKGKTVVITGDGSPFGLNYNYEITENKGGDHIIHNRDTQLVLDDYVFGDMGEAGKKSYLFIGPYGNGKTETAMEFGRRANRDHNMTFFYVKDATLFEQSLRQSKKYQPCVVFVEDLDEIGSGEERDARMNKILNTIDGIETKGNDLTVIFTTNHEHRINPAMRRPGRISTIVPFKNPTIETSVKIMQRYFAGVPGNDSVDYQAMAGLLGDISASVVAEACKKAFGIAGRRGGITNDILEGAIRSMEFQIKLMQTPPETVPVERQFVEVLRNVLFTPEVMVEFAKTYNNY